MFSEHLFGVSEALREIDGWRDVKNQFIAVIIDLLHLKHPILTRGNIPLLFATWDEYITRAGKKKGLGRL